MIIEEAPPDGLMEWASGGELDWDALYADQLPRVLNYFRFRFGCHADAEELTSRTFEKAWRARKRYRKDLAGFFHLALHNSPQRRSGSPAVETQSSAD